MAHPPIEILERGRLLAAATLADDGTLTVLGTESDDVFMFKLSTFTTASIPPGTGTALEVTVNREGAGFDPDRVRRIVIRAGAGNDTVKIMGPLSDAPEQVTLSVDGGDGDDLL